MFSGGKSSEGSWLSESDVDFFTSGALSRALLVLSHHQQILYFELSAKASISTLTKLLEQHISTCLVL